MSSPRQVQGTHQLRLLVDLRLRVDGRCGLSRQKTGRMLDGYRDVHLLLAPALPSAADRSRSPLVPQVPPRCYERLYPR